MPGQIVIVKLVRFIIMMVILAAMGILFAMAGIFIGANILGGNSADFGALGLAIIGAIIGFLVGLIAGMLLIKRVFHLKGPLYLGIIGAIIGGLIVLALEVPINTNINSDLLLAIYIIIVTGLAAGGLSIPLKR